MLRLELRVVIWISGEWLGTPRALVLCFSVRTALRDSLEKSRDSENWRDCRFLRYTPPSSLLRWNGLLRARADRGRTWATEAERETKWKWKKTTTNKREPLEKLENFFPPLPDLRIWWWGETWTANKRGNATSRCLARRKEQKEAWRKKEKNEKTRRRRNDLIRLIAERGKRTSRPRKQSPSVRTRPSSVDVLISLRVGWRRIVSGISCPPSRKRATQITVRWVDNIYDAPFSRRHLFLSILI